MNRPGNSESGAPKRSAARRTTALRAMLAWISRIETVVAVTCLSIMATIVFLDVLGRELLGAGITGAQKIGVFAFVYAGFLGLPLATGAGEHLRPRILDGALEKLLGPRPLTVLSHAVAAILSFALALAGLIYVRESFMLGERSPAIELPVWIVQLVLPYAFLSSGLRHAAYAIAPELGPGASDPVAGAVGEAP